MSETYSCTCQKSFPIFAKQMLLLAVSRRRGKGDFDELAERERQGMRTAKPTSGH